MFGPTPEASRRPRLARPCGPSRPGRPATADSPTGIGGATGLDPHAQATYVGFNFTTIWTINAGTSRPYLQNPAPATPPH